MAWNGVAMYGGLAAGAPTGILLQQYFGNAVAFSSILILAIIGWIAVRKLQAVPIHKADKPRVSFARVVSQISTYGFGLAFSAISFGCISSFITLFFQDKGWANASLAFVLFGTSYIGVRVFFASYTNKYGGNKVAFVSLLIQLIGQIMLWQAFLPEMALLGAFVTGIGFSLIFPAFGVEAVKDVEPQMRGTALGAYVAFFDVALAIVAPLAGIVASSFGYQNVFFLGILGTIVALVIALKSLLSIKR
jgi:predicted MFS family arabinose efflux permease